MSRIVAKILKYAFMALILLSACARVGNPSGGKKDVVPPRLLKSIPSHQTKNFNGKEIILYFDEYVQLKDPSKNILISPPLPHPPVIVPAVASKVFKIKFQDSLLPNTTYLINFGNSIADYNEGNKLTGLQLVFSTGSVIDSLSFKAKASMVHYDDKVENLLLGLYAAKDYKDSLVFSKKPYYVARKTANDVFEFNYLKPGTYRLIGILDENNDFKYYKGKEAIGFIDKEIHIPGDTLAEIHLFKEPERLSFDKVEQKSAHHVQIKVKGNIDSLQVVAADSLEKSLKTVQNNQLDFWYDTPGDSIKLLLKLGNKTKKFFKKRLKNRDSLQLRLLSGAGNPMDSIEIVGNTPLIKYNKDSIRLFMDSIPVACDLQLNNRHTFYVILDKKRAGSYKLELLPGAITDFVGNKLKDTIHPGFRIRKKEDFGNLELYLKKHKGVPRFVELIRNKKVYRKTKTTTSDTIRISYIFPGKYKIRVVYDINENNRWDTGDFLKHRQAEETFEPANEIEIRPNWDVNQTYD